MSEGDISNNKVKLIAELGVNHNGSITIAKKLIDVAVDCGADYAKFQCFDCNSLASKTAALAPYQKKSTAHNSQYKLLEMLQLSERQLTILKQYCDRRKIKFLASAFDCKSLDILKRLGEHTLKIPSGEITNYFLLKESGEKFANIIMSTGASDLTDVIKAVQLVRKGSATTQICLMHCTSDYPAKPAELDLLSIRTLQKKFRLPVGYSDHSVGFDASCLSVALGVTLIEKHLTLSNNMIGPDHKASIEPKAFKEFVSRIRATEKMLGSGNKHVGASEKKNKLLIRKSLYAKEKIREGEIFTPDNLIALRPGTGICAMQARSILGTKAKKQYDPGEPIKK